MNVFDLSAKITLDKSGYEKDLNEAGSKFAALGEKVGTIGSKLASGIGTAMKAGIAAVGAASTAVGALATNSVKAYADYEQMVGGVQKLYGNMGMSLTEYAQSVGKSVSEAGAEYYKLEAAQNKVLANAQNAYKTASMSANEYMEIATSFSAALINSLDGDSLKAADATDKAMRAISDNWNTFGGDIGMIQGAFQGFAKGNYTMLDNLKLGYGGTKTEMEKLIADANEYAKTIGQASDLSIDSFADIVTAIDLIQQKQNIAGTTAREASTTISGSLGMAKAAWENLLTGMSDGEADLDKLMNNLVDSITGYTDEAGQHVNGVIDNILPVAEKALGSVGSMIEKLAPVISEQLPKLVTSILPSLLSAGANIVSSLIQGITEALPQLLFMAGDIIYELLQGLVDATNGQQSTLMEIINTILGVFEENYMDFIDMGIQILDNITQGIIKGLPDLMYYAQEIILYLTNAIIENLPMVISTASQFILTLTNGIAQALPELIPKAVEAVTTFVESLIDNADLLIDGAIALIVGLAEGIVNALPRLIEKAPVIVEKLLMAIINNVPKLIEASVQIVIKLVSGIIQNLPKLVQAAVEIIGALVQGIVNSLGKIVETGSRIKDSFYNAIRGAISSAGQWGGDLIDSFVSGIRNAIGKVSSAVSSVASTVRSYLHFSEPDVGPLANFHTYAPDMMKLFAEGIEDNTDLVTDQIEKSFDFEDMLTPSVGSMTSNNANSGMGSYNNTVTINVYGAEGQDINALAEIISEKINNATKRQTYAWGGA